jgi:hypothetical protein
MVSGNCLAKKVRCVRVPFGSFEDDIALDFGNRYVCLQFIQRKQLQIVIDTAYALRFADCLFDALPAFVVFLSHLISPFLVANFAPFCCRNPPILRQFLFLASTWQKLGKSQNA